MTAETIECVNIPRDANGVAHVVALSGGKDSTAMALALSEREPRPYVYVCTPTGDELPEMVRHMENVERLIGAPIVRLMNGTLATQIEKQHMLPNFRSRWCTRILKLKPFGRFMELAAPAVAYVGIRADEDEREGTRPGGDGAPIGADIKQDFPFQRWEWGVSEVWAFLESKGVKIPARTDCARCPYQKLGEWYNLWEQNPELFASAEADETRWGHTYRSAQRDSWPAALAELRARFEKGDKPLRSLKMMESREGMCRACSL